ELSSSLYFLRIASNVHRFPSWPSSTPFTSKGTAPIRSASVKTSAAGTKKNSACGSTNFLINQGQATRSTVTRSRVIHFMGSAPRSVIRCTGRYPRLELLLDEVQWEWTRYNWSPGVHIDRHPLSILHRTQSSGELVDKEAGLRISWLHAYRAAATLGRLIH